MRSLNNFNPYNDGIKKHKNTISVFIGKHFKQRFAERWKEQTDIIGYLNEKMNEGMIVSDVVDRALFFPTAGVYVPISADNFAITFQFRIIKENNRLLKVEWKDYKDMERKKDDVKYVNR